jgi:hypothetical protein
LSRRAVLLTSARPGLVLGHQGGMFRESELRMKREAKLLQGFRLARPQH